MWVYKVGSNDNGMCELFGSLRLAQHYMGALLASADAGENYFINKVYITMEIQDE